MSTDMCSGEAALRTICLKTQVTLVRNVVGYPFPGPTPRHGATVPVNQWLARIATIHPFEDLTDDADLMPQAEIRHGLAAPDDRTPAYRLLRFHLNVNDTHYVVWCELMAGNHLTFSITETDLDFEDRITVLEAFTDRFAAVFDFAYDEQFGYLTALPSLTGTGLRIRSWLHLSGLASLDYLPQMVRAAEVKGVLTEFLPDATEPPPGDIFILYNRFSLNLPAATIVRDYKTFLLRLARQEMKARMRLAHDRVVQLYDELNRTLLISRNALLISEREALNLLSSYWTGCSCGALEPVQTPDYAFHDCFNVVQDALCPKSLLKPNEPHNLSALPPICRQEYLLNHDILRALWFRRLAEATFTPDFLRRITRL